MNNKIKIAALLFASILSIQARADNIFLGCGTIVSMRESTQRPLPSKLKDAYSQPATGGGFFGHLLSYVPGVGVAAAVTGEVVGSLATSAVSSNSKKSDWANQVQTETYKNVMAIEFRFDDGVVVNVPVYVVSGMRYSVGTRLSAMIEPGYDSFALSANPLFSGTPEYNDSDYGKKCMINDPVPRGVALDAVKNAVDESKIVNPTERRQAATTESVPLGSQATEANVGATVAKQPSTQTSQPSRSASE